MKGNQLEPIQSEEDCSSSDSDEIDTDFSLEQLDNVSNFEGVTQSAKQ